MMASVHQGKPRVVPDITKLLKQREKITEFLKHDKTKEVVDDVGVIKPDKSGISEHVPNDIKKDNALYEKKDETFSYEGELTIMENHEPDEMTTEAENINIVNGNNNAEVEEGAGNSAPSMSDLKNTINEVFWNKINSKF
jgi:hypothetical protein